MKKPLAYACMIVPLTLISCVSSRKNPERNPQGALPLFASQAVSSQGLFGKGIEGPAADLQNNLYVVNFARNGTIAIMRPGEDPQLWLELPHNGIGNSIRFNREGRMLVADRKNHRILEVDLQTKRTDLVAENDQMNQPNDFAVSKTGELYMSDPSWSTKSPGMIWGLNTQKQMVLLASNLRAVNGIDLSPDEKKLYFSESVGGGIWSFDIIQGRLENKKLVIQFERDSVDGLRVDAEGNLYVARITKGRIDRVSPDGQVINSIPLLGKDPTNMAFGGADGKTVFVTMRDGGYIESFRAPAPGREWLMQKGSSTP